MSMGNFLSKGRARLSSARRKLATAVDFGGSRRAEDRRALPSESNGFSVAPPPPYVGGYKLILAVAVGVAFVAGCNRHAEQKHGPPPAVTVAAVEQKQIVEWDEFTGRVEPVEAVEVRPRVSGYIQEIKFQSGQLVKKGDVLLRIDPRWHQADFDRRQAEFEQAKVRLENAKREAERAGQLLANKAISTEESDARQSRYQEAKAASLAAAAALDSARLDLEYTQVRSPIDGRVSRALLTEGNYVRRPCRSGDLAHDDRFGGPGLCVCRRR